jgi:hypothetical protein
MALPYLPELAMRAVRTQRIISRSSFFATFAKSAMPPPRDALL